MRFYDFAVSGLLTFNVVRLKRHDDGAWTQRVTSTNLWPQTRQELAEALAGARFEAIAYFGDLKGMQFDAAGSPNLVIRAFRDRKRLPTDRL